jgi:hypothetical protein
MKIKSLIAFVMLSGALLTILFALANTQANGNAQTEAEVTVPTIASTSTDNGGMRTRADTVVPSIRYGSHIDVSQLSVSLERLDVRSVTLSAPNQIGVNRSVAVSPTTRAQKFVNPDGSQIIVLIIKSSGASGIGVHFRNFELARGEEVYVYGPAAESIVFGPFTNKGPWGSGEFWSGTIAGDTAIIEFYTRTAKNEKAFEIFEVSHIFPELSGRLLSDEPDVAPLPCERDASCYSAAEKNAVGRILYNDNGLFVCTGTLVNDCAQDHIPYFLTANHCVPTQTVAQTVEIFWFYQTTSCNSGVLRNWVHSPPGANLLATQSSNDFSLLRLLNNAPAGAVFSGWTSAGQSTGTSVFGFHHPRGYLPPSIESHLRRAGGNIIDTSAACPDSGLVNGYLAGWTAGTTEPGASGSGLWNSSHALVGILSCGEAPTCSTPTTTWYSKFSNFYPQIRQYICSGAPSPTPTPALGARAAIADFNGDGSPDYVLHRLSTHQTAIWYLHNNIYAGGAFGPTLPAGWGLRGVADFNRDSRPDYAVFNTSSHKTGIYYLNNNVYVSAAYGPTLPAGWELAATSDFNANSNPDYVLYKASLRQTAIYYLNNNVYVSGGYGPTLLADWSLVGVADFNHDGHPDYALFNPGTRQTAIWYLSGRALIGSASGPSVPNGWALVATADFNGDGKPDYVIYNASTRQTGIYYLNNNVYAGSAYGPTLPTGWTLAAP